jgi:hypothetical protein
MSGSCAQAPSPHSFAVASRLAVSIRRSVMSDAEEMVATGGELALFEAVGRWPDFLLLCRSSPVGMSGVT